MKILSLLALLVLSMPLTAPRAARVDSLSADSLIVPATSMQKDGWSAGKVLNDAKNGVWLFATDLGAMLSKPTRMNRNDYLYLGLMLGGGAILYAYDEDIDRVVNRNRDLWVVRTSSDTGESIETLGLMGKTNKYYFGGIVLGYVTGWKPLQRISTDILFSHYLSGIYRNGFKQLVGRARPREGVGAYDFGTGRGGTSLPSGHSSTIMQLATIASHYADWWPASVACYTLAGCVCFQRIESRQHWASDVWIGALNGIAIARLVIRRHDEKGVIWVPSYTHETGSFGLYVEKGF